MSVASTDRCQVNHAILTSGPNLSAFAGRARSLTASWVQVLESTSTICAESRARARWDGPSGTAIRRGSVVLAGSKLEEVVERAAISPVRAAAARSRPTLALPFVQSERMAGSRVRRPRCQSVGTLPPAAP